MFVLNTVLSSYIRVPSHLALTIFLNWSSYFVVTRLKCLGWPSILLSCHFKCGPTPHIIPYIISQIRMRFVIYTVMDISTRMISLENCNTGYWCCLVLMSPALSCNMNEYGYGWAGYSARQRFGGFNLAPFYQHGLTVIRAWTSNYIHKLCWIYLLIHALPFTKLMLK